MDISLERDYQFFMETSPVHGSPCKAFVKYISKNTVWKLKYVSQIGAMPLDMLLAVFCKAASPGAPLIFLCTDWLFPHGRNLG